MSTFKFPEEVTCPQCHGRFQSADRRDEYNPVVVVVCPHCGVMLWRPGLDETSPLFTFDPDADAGGI